MKGYRVFYYLFVVFLIVFFWRTGLYWYNASYSDVSENAGVLLYAALVGVEIVSLCMIALSPKYKYQNNRIVNLCFLWEILMIVVLNYNGTAYSQWFKCLAWPLFFQASYLFIRLDTQLLDSFQKPFYVLSVMGGMLMLLALRLKDLESQTNMVYFFLLTIPAILLTSNKKWRYYILIFATFAAFISMKRSVILSFILFWCVIEFKFLFEKRNPKMAIALIVVGGIAVYGSFKIADHMSGGSLSLRTVDYQKEDITNGRETIYLETVDMIAKSSPMHLILGNGHNAVLRDSPLEKSAHNEILEIIYDYGIIMLLIYLCFWVYVLRQWHYHYKNNTIYFIPYTLSVCLFAVMAMVSQLVLYCSYFLYLVMFWGMTAALRDNQEKKDRLSEGDNKQKAINNENRYNS